MNLAHPVALKSAKAGGWLGQVDSARGRVPITQESVDCASFNVDFFQTDSSH